MQKSDYIFGIRAVIEALESGKSIDKVLVRKDLSGELSKELFARIREYGVLMQRVPVERLNRITMKNHQGVVAIGVAGGLSPARQTWCPRFMKRAGIRSSWFLTGLQTRAISAR